MNRSRVVLATLVMLTSVLAGGRPVYAADSPPGDQPRDGVLVTGVGEVLGEPDTLVANLGVETVASTVGEALDRAGTAAGGMRDALVRAGTARADLQTSNVDISSRRNDAGEVTGYTVSQGITATIRNLPRAGALLSAAVAAGGDAARLNGVSLAVGDDAALLTAARKKAFADARAKAELYAGAAGRRLGPVVKVIEVVPGSREPGDQDRVIAAYASVPVEPGRQRLTVTVTVEWAFQRP